MMNPTALTAGTGLVLAALLTVLWSLQQRNLGRSGRVRALWVLVSLMAATATVLATEPEFDEQTQLTDLGPVGPPPMWRVQAGDHYWGIATATLASRGQPPADEQIEPYWRSLVGFNQAHRRAVADPDLLRIGELVWLPEPSPG